MSSARSTSELRRLLLCRKPFCLSFPICVSIFFPVYETHWPPALLCSVPPVPPQKSTLYLGGGEDAQCDATPVGQPAPGRSGGWSPACRSPARVLRPPEAHCCRPGPGAPAPRKPEWSLSSPPAALLLCKTGVLPDKLWWPDRLPPAAEVGRREVLGPRAWSKTGRGPTPSPFLKGVSGSRSRRGSQRASSLTLAA